MPIGTSWSRVLCAVFLAVATAFGCGGSGKAGDAAADDVTGDNDMGDEGGKALSWLSSPNIPTQVDFIALPRLGIEDPDFKG